MKRQSVTEAFKLLDLIKCGITGTEKYEFEMAISVIKDYITELEAKSDAVSSDLSEIKDLLKTIADKLPIQLPYINNPTPTPYNTPMQPWDPLNPFHITCNTQPSTQEGEKQ